MSCVKLSELLPFVETEVIGCPLTLVKSSILIKATEFCERSLAWRETLEPLNIKSGRSTYELPALESTRIVSAISVLFSGELVTPATEDDMDMSQDVDWRVKTNAKPVFFYQPSVRQVRLVSIPDTDIVDALVVKVALKPIPAGELLGEDVFNDFYEAIASGAKARLMAMPGKKWSEPNMVAYYNGIFESGISKALSKTMVVRTDHQATGRVEAYY